VYSNVLVYCENRQNSATGTHGLMILNKTTQSWHVVIEARPRIDAGPAYRPGSDSFVLIEAGGFYPQFYGNRLPSQSKLLNSTVNILL